MRHWCIRALGSKLLLLGLLALQTGDYDTVRTFYLLGVRGSPMYGAYGILFDGACGPSMMRKPLPIILSLFFVATVALQDWVRQVRIQPGSDSNAPKVRKVV